VIEIQGRIVFDSWHDAVPDLRGNPGDERHLIYEGGGVLLDLLLKPAGEGACLQIGGQVMPTDDLSQTVSHVPVFLDDGRASSRTHTNVLGEFSFQYAPDNGCFDICIVFGSRKFLVSGLDSKEPRNWQVLTSGSSQTQVGGVR
jgi:hypothetical protein